MRFISRILGNGLRVLLIPMPGTKTLCGVFAVRAGWKFEEAGLNEGIAHLLEHMAFKATGRYPKQGEIAQAIEGTGGIYNASTNPDLILYYLKTTARHTDLLCDLLQDIILNPLLREEDIEMEKGPVKEELAMYITDPVMNLNALILPELLFGDHPAGWPGTGTKEQIERLNRNLLLNYYKRFFVGPNAIVCFAGRIPDPPRFFDKIGRCFASLSEYLPRGQKIPFFETQTGARVRIVHTEIQQTYIALGIKCPSAQSPRRAALTIFNAILGGAESSRLFREIRELKGLAYDIHSSLDLQSDLGVLTISAGLEQNRWKEGLQIILRELRLLRDKPVGTDELARTKEMILGQSEMVLERPEIVAQLSAANWAISGKIERFSQMARKIRTVTPEDIRSAANEILRDDRISLAIMGPHKNEEHGVQKLFHIKN